MIRIAIATTDDAAEIATCLRAAFEAYRDQYTPGAYTDTVLTADGVRRRLETMTVLVAKVGDLIVGTVGGSVDRGEGHLRGMAVLPDWHGAGVAQLLLNHIERQLAAAGCRVVSLDTTTPLVRAIAFYERHGYRASGVVTDFFGMPLHEYRKRIE